MIRHYAGTKLTPKQLASHIVADYGPHFTDAWNGASAWEETKIFMTEKEIAETERFISIQIKRVLKVLNLKELDY